jgi:hypothetical protein
VILDCHSSNGHHSIRCIDQQGAALSIHARARPILADELLPFFPLLCRRHGDRACQRHTLTQQGVQARLRPVKVPEQSHHKDVQEGRQVGDMCVGAVRVPTEMKNSSQSLHTTFLLVGTSMDVGGWVLCVCDACMRAVPQLGQAQCTQFVCGHPTACLGSPTVNHSHTCTPRSQADTFIRHV